MDCIDFQKRFATICDPEPDEELLSHVQNELQVLKEIKEPADDAERYGLKSENINKNRNYELIPHNADGLFLSRSKTGNYINAVSVDSFKAHDSYIVTQMPLPDTINDFWQLIIEQGCQAIVMLNDMSTEDKVSILWSDTAFHAHKLFLSNLEDAISSLVDISSAIKSYQAFT
ncbi:hypothetical protein LSH36_1478g00037 [Paralvinella palmiformis]|uniref:Tyrosine-protein phosphatase domain-containing protein n=1 Tax=Paralvinella palmiformis TaxID=53620 RepID=A0AAD9ITQ7_9ANNE|nr:hypothetical protein LSH36_1478g00037 [Paralvinella palmiformis]